MSLNYPALLNHFYRDYLWSVDGNDHIWSKELFHSESFCTLLYDWVNYRFSAAPFHHKNKIREQMFMLQARLFDKAKLDLVYPFGTTVGPTIARVDWARAHITPQSCKISFWDKLFLKI